MNTSVPRQGEVWESFSLEQWLHWQQQLHLKQMELGLERCRQVAGRMGLLPLPFPVISVAGTNGKGSSVAMCESILHAAGYKVGAYTSPHLVQYNERVRLQCQPVSDEMFCEAFSRVEHARADASLTFFEFGTLAALHILRANQIDIAVLEVGLGGRLDAVNVVAADLALITSIDCDHEQWLGREREAIALEKGGIMRSGKLAVYADINPVDSLPRMARQIGAKLAVYGTDFDCSHNGQEWQWQGGGRTRSALPLPHPYSRCQLYNASGVLQALDFMAGNIKVTDEAINKGLADSYIPCRFTVVPGNPEIVLDVAHNPQAVAELVASISVMPQCKGKTHVLLGILKDKDIDKILRSMMPLADSWHCVSIEQQRGLSAGELAARLEQLGAEGEVQCHPNVAVALAALQQKCESGDRVVITGSFMVVGPAYGCIKNNTAIVNAYA
ncbi:MAG: bifunctional tetrahydrofolate synthase/dihydrofolate synthase [Candidatus Porifericomitaceae bacterium WSBS_2022_MAG_OTU9]